MPTWCMTLLDIKSHPMASLSSFGALGTESSIMPETTARATCQKMTLQNPFFHPGTCLTLACSSSTSKLARNHEFVVPFYAILAPSCPESTETKTRTGARQSKAAGFAVVFVASVPFVDVCLGDWATGQPKPLIETFASALLAKT